MYSKDSILNLKFSHYLPSSLLDLSSDFCDNVFDL